MITINFFEDGAYIKGHDVPSICHVVSYAMWSFLQDSLNADKDVTYYQSANDENWSMLGFTYTKINPEIEEHVKLLERFKDNITCWLTELEHDRVKIIYHKEKSIDWNLALEDAKQEQNY